MHSLETGIIVSIAAFFFFSFLTFTFLRETNISKEIALKYESEKANYTIDKRKDYNPEYINNIISIIKEEGVMNEGAEESNSE